MPSDATGTDGDRTLPCAWCRRPRPDDDARCPSCGEPRFRHKTEGPDEFWERRRLLDEHGG